MKKNLGTKIISLLLSLLMVLTTMCFFNPFSALTAYAASVKSADKTMSDLKFVVPEVIYLYPNATSGNSTTATPFEWYVNNNSDGSANSTYSTTGKIYYSYSAAQNASISYRFLNSSLNDTLSGGSVTLSASSSLGTSKDIDITAGTSPALAKDVTGCYIEWILSFTDSVDGVAKKAYAYTYVYKPYIYPVAAGSDVGTGTGSGANWAGQVTWINGFHSLTYVAGNLDNDWDDTWVNYYTKGNFFVFTNAGSTGYIGTTKVTGVQYNSGSGIGNSSVGEYKYTYSGYSKGYVLFGANSNGTYYVQKGDNNNPSIYGDKNSSTTTSPVANYTVGKYRENAKEKSGAVKTNTYGSMYIDTSRYSNLSQIPNLSIGLVVTDDEDSGGNTGTWYIADHSETTEKINGYKTWYSNATSTWYNDYTYKIAGQGTSGKDCSYCETEGLRYAGAWPRTLLGSTTTQGATQDYWAKGFYGNKDGSYYANSNTLVKMQATYYNKANLRTAVKNAIAKMPALGVNGLSAIGKPTSCYFDADTNYKWTAFQTAYRNAVEALVKLDGSVSNPDTLATALNNALAALCTKVTVSGNGGTLSDAESGYITIGTSQTASYTPKVTATRTGYTFTGWNSNASGTGATSATVGYNNTVYAIWKINTGTLKINPNGGTWGGSSETTSKTQNYNTTLSIPVPTRIGYTFTGWTCSGTNGTLSSTTAAATYTFGATNEYTDTITANWQINSYTVIFKDGDTVLDTQTVNYGSSATAPESPSHPENYTDTTHKEFSGWDKSFTNISDNITVNAVYTDVEHTLVDNGSIEAKCETAGVTKKKCTVCQYTSSVDVEALDHSWGNPVNHAATCTEAGYNTYTCTRNDCGKTKTESDGTTALGHDFTVTVTDVAATCTADGLLVMKCSRCEATSETVRPALGHEKEIHDYKDSDCTNEGNIYYVYCTRCQKYFSDEECENEITKEQTVISAKGHTEVIDAKKEPTCTETGLTEGKHCSVCGSVLVAQTVIPAKGHTSGETVKENVLDAKCLTDGKYDEVVYCTVCQIEISRNTVTVEKLGHDIVTHEAKEATCTEDGYFAYDTCSRCDYTTYRVDPAKGHTTVIDAAVPATCTETGLTEGSHCSVCKTVFTPQTVTEALGHNYGDWTHVDATKTHQRVCANDASHIETVDCEFTSVVTAPTCLNDGYTTYTCSDCGYTYVDDNTAALGHAYGDWTHVENTKTHQRVCTNDASHIETANCEFTSVVTAPTCLSDGYTTYTCTDCGYSYVDDNTTALGHAYGDWTHVDDTKTHQRVCANDASHIETANCEFTVVVTAPTCLNDGYTTYTCTDCGFTYVDDNTTALGHAYGDWTHVENTKTHQRVCANDASHIETADCEFTSVVTAPTCLNDGYTTYTCSDCGYTYVDDNTVALGHDWDDGVVTADAKCEEDGVKTYTCLRDGCNATKTEPISAIGHTYEDVITAPTCTEQGYTTHTCSECGKSYVDTYVDALDHAWDDGIVTTAPTCIDKGIKTFICTRDNCGATYTEKTDPLGHDYINHEAKAPTCTEIGWDAYDTCSRCDYTTYVEKAALGHNFGEWKVVTEATETTAGLKRRECIRCDAYEEETIPVSTGKRIIKFVNIDKMHYVLDNDGEEYCIYNSGSVYWDKNRPLNFTVYTYSNFAYSDVIVKVNGVEISPDANGVYTVPAGDSLAVVTVTGAVDNGDGTKLSFWEWLVRLFKKIFSAFGSQFGGNSGSNS